MSAQNSDSRLMFDFNYFSTEKVPKRGDDRRFSSLPYNIVFSKNDVFFLFVAAYGEIPTVFKKR